ncbi:MAG: NfeD family protein [Chthoniobacterales bacterium]
MRRILALLLAISTAIAVIQPAGAASEPEITKGAVVVVPLDGAVTDAQFVFLRRILKLAESAEASAFVLDMDTPGGSLSAAVEILHLLQKATIPTYTWVNTNAGSAGALIALSTKHVYMAPVSAIGAAAPVSSGGAEIPETMSEKIISYYSGYFRSAAESNGYNPELAEAFINKEKEFKIGDKVISPQGSLLTLSAQEAVKVYDGKPLLASGIAADIDELKEKAGLSGPTIEIVPSGFEKLAQWITTLAPLFLLGGVIGAYVEFKSPGFGVAGFLSALCFLIFFAGHYVAGLTGLEMVAVFGLGLLLVIFELIFFPGIAIVALLGAALMLGALFFTMVDHFPGQPIVPTMDMIVQPMINLGITIVLAILIIGALARFLPDIPLFRRLMLSTASPLGTSIPLHAVGSLMDSKASVGDTGTASTVLRPAGKAMIGAAYLDVTTDGDFIEPGTEVIVTRVQGTRITVAANTK